MTDAQPVLVDRHGDVVVLTLNRPERRNALNLQLATALVEEIDKAQQDAAAIVLTGAGTAFCAGLDLRDLGADALHTFPNTPAAVAASTIPVIAAVNGAAVTGGFEIALAADLMIASTDAVFADTHRRVQVFPGPVLVTLPRRVGMAWARQMSMTGDFVDAGTALRIGLVNEVHEPAQLLARAVQLATAASEGDRRLLGAMRTAWHETEQLSPADADRVWAEHASRFHDSTGESIAAHRDEVLERSRRQRAGEG